MKSDHDLKTPCSNRELKHKDTVKTTTYPTSKGQGKILKSFEHEGYCFRRIGIKLLIPPVGH